MEFFKLFQQLQKFERLMGEQATLPAELAKQQSKTPPNLKAIEIIKAKIASHADKVKAARAEMMKEIPPALADRATSLIQSYLEPTSSVEASLHTFPENLKSLRDSAGQYFDPTLYAAILPLTKLAHLFENNGIPEEHAFKLTVLFGDKEKIVNYLGKFHQENPHAQMVHDALLFSLPPFEGCHYMAWRKMAHSLMMDKNFRKVLPNAAAIEALITKEQGKTPDTKEMGAQKEILSDRIKCLKALQSKQSHKGENFAVLSEESRKERRATLKKEISNARVALAQASYGSPDILGDITLLRAYHEVCMLQQKGVARYFAQHELTVDDAAKFEKLDRSQAGKYIPDITLDGATMGFPGFYLKKVNVQDEMEAARAACIGKLTGCCQSLSGQAGEPCTIHGLTSPYGGFYMLCKGDVQNPQIEDEVWGATWAWRSQDDNLVFDSIEMHPKYRKRQINEAGEKGKHLAVKMFSTLAHEMVESDKSLLQVSCGAGSGISKLFGVELYKPAERFKDYGGHSDARAQRMIAYQNAPYLLHGKIDEKKFDALLRHFIEKNLQGVDESTEFSSLNGLPDFLTYAITSPHLNLADSALGLIKEKYPFLMKSWMAYSEQLKTLKALKEKISQPITPEEKANLLKQLECIQPARMLNIVFFSDGETLLTTAIKAKMSPDFLIDLIVRSDVNVSNGHDATPLMLALKNQAPLGVINALLAKGAAVNVSNWDADTPLLVALQNKASFKVVNALLAKGAAMNVSNRYGETPLLVALQNKASFKVVNALLAKGAAMNVSNQYGETPLLVALQNKASFKVVNALLAKGAAMNVSNRYGETPLISAILGEAPLEIINTLLAKGAAVNAINEDGNTPLMVAVQNGASLETINFLLESDKAGVAVNLNRGGEGYGETPFMLALIKEAPLELINALLLAYGARFNMRNMFGHTPLIIALYKGAPLEVINILLAKGAEVNASDEGGCTPLMYALENNASLGVINILLAKGAEVNASDKGGCTPLIYALKNNASLEVIKVLLENGAAVKVRNRRGVTPLMVALRKKVEIGNKALLHSATAEIILALLDRGAEVNDKAIEFAKDAPIILAIFKEHLAQKLREHQLARARRFSVVPGLALTPLQDALAVVLTGNASQQNAAELLSVEARSSRFNFTPLREALASVEQPSSPLKEGSKEEPFLPRTNGWWNIL